MAFDYDIVILGGSPAAIDAAIAANALKARVAIVEPPALAAGVGRLPPKLPPNLILPLLQQMQRSEQLGLAWCRNPAAEDPQPPTVNFERLLHWSSAAAANLARSRERAVLSSLGIDVIRGWGEFCRQPTLHIAANGRRLRGRNYLLAVGSEAIATGIEGLAQTGYLTPETFLYRIAKEQKRPAALTIIGDDPRAIEIAQILVRLGTQVTIVVAGPHILPQEDPEAARWLQAQLEAEGVRVLTQTTVTQAKAIEGQKWVQAGRAAIAADEILLATYRRPQLQSLNLNAAQIQAPGGILRVNSKLQTANPRIYACGEALGGYPFEHLGKYEAGIAIKNALFHPFWSVNYHGVPWAIFAEPTLARVGLTEPQARRRYGEDFTILRGSFSSLSKFQTLGETAGFGKAIVRSNGSILGVHLVSSDAGELIHPFALAIQNHLKIDEMATLATVTNTKSEIYHQIGTAWQQHKINRNQFLDRILEAWSGFRRS